MGASGRVVWAHDHVFVRTPTGELFSEGKLPSAVWDRYLDAFAEVVVCARVRGLRPDESLERLNPTERPGVTFLEVPNLASLSHLRAARSDGRRILKAAIGEGDAVIARLPSETGLLALRIAHDLGRPAAVEAVGCAWDAYWYHGSWSGKGYAPLAFLRMRRAVRRADHVLYVTEEFLQRRYPTSGVSVACSNVELSSPGDEVLIARVGRSAPPTRLGTIGSPALHYKGVDTAILALAKLGRPEVTLSVVGAGDPRQMMGLAERSGVARQVAFNGALPSGNAVVRWLDGLDIYLQPSRQEGLPRALVEAMGRGCPAIGSRAGGIPELLAEEALHPTGDAATLARRLQHALGDPAWLVAQAQRNFQVARRFDRSVLRPRRTEFWRRFSDRAIIASMRR